MKCYELPKWIMFAGYGLTIGQQIFIRKGMSEDDRAYVIAHEYRHTLQFKEFGFFTFILLYFKELIKVGYFNNKFEVEARAYGVKNAYKYKNYIS